MQRIGKARKQRTKRLEKARESKLVENGKSAIVLKGLNTSQTIVSVLSELAALKKPLVRKLTKRNAMHPFEDQSSIEFLSRINDSSLVLFGSSSKKRPHNLVMARCFDFQMLDMFELGVNSDTFKAIEEFRSATLVHMGSKPLFFFAGDEFELNSDLGRFRNFIVDFFQGERLEQLDLAGVDRVIVCTAVDSKLVLFRQYGIALKKSGGKIPNVKLEEVGPRMDLTLRRTTQSSEEMQTASRKMPRLVKSNTQRGNIEVGPLGQTLGRVHMQRQDMAELALRRMKGLKKGAVVMQPADDQDEVEGDMMEDDA